MPNSHPNSDMEVGVLRREIARLEGVLDQQEKQLAELRKGSEADRERDRLLQVGTEYWKVVCDIFKHLMTVNVAAMAVFGALLGGFYKNATALPGVLDSVVIVTIFLFFIASLRESWIAAHDARGNVLKMRDVKNRDDMEALSKKRSSRRIFAGYLFLYGVATLALFFLINAAPQRLAGYLFLAGVAALALFVTKNIRELRNFLKD